MIPSRVGISGHALHGGFGMSSHTNGLAVDWMIGATVVLANSSIVHCSRTENSDLFWALRGAGSSFGVVAEYEFSTFAAPSQVTYFTAPMGWNSGNTANNWMALQDYVQNTMPANLNFRLAISSFESHLEGLFYGDSAGLRSALAPLFAKAGGSISSSNTVGWLEQLAYYAYGTALDQTHPYSVVSGLPTVRFQRRSATS